MGRKRVELTEAEKAARKDRYWGETRNAARRAKYQQDQVYREAVIKQVRDGQRARKVTVAKGKGLTVPPPADCRVNIARLGELGAVRQATRADGRVRALLTLTIEEMAEALGRNTQVLYRWMTSGVFPRPALSARNGDARVQAVYGQDEAAKLLNVFGKHQERSQYLKSFHAETVQRLRAVSEEANRCYAEEEGWTDERSNDDADPRTRAAGSHLGEGQSEAA